MTFKKNTLPRLFLLSLFVLCKPFLIFAVQSQQPKGRELCVSLFDYLGANNFSPKVQQLLNSPQNDFPYNIYMEDFCRAAPEDGRTEKVLFAFEMEGAYSHKELVVDFIRWLSENSRTCSPTVLFAYGEKPPVTKQGMLYGTKIFLDDFYFENDFTAVYIDLGAEENKIRASSNKGIAPGELLKACLNAFAGGKIQAANPPIFLSQLYKFSLQDERLLQTFFEREVPAIRLDFSSREDSQSLLQVLCQIASFFEGAPDLHNHWDQHFIVCRLPGGYRILGEKKILILLFTVIFILLLFIFLFGYINSFIKFEAWKKIRFIWFAAPLTFLLVVAGFFMGKSLFFLFSPRTPFGRIFLLLWLQLFLSLALTSAFFLLLALFNHKFTDRSVDYLILISTFVNQAIFSCTDISLFPMFLLIFSAAFFTIFFRRFFSHFYLFIILILLLFPYSFAFLGGYDSSSLYSFFATSSYYHVVFSIILTPIFLLYLRLVIKFRQTHKSVAANSSFVLSYMLFILFILTLICAISIPLRNRSVRAKTEPLLVSKNTDFISLSHSDKAIFDDIIRTIEIRLEKEPLLCDVQVFSPGQQPLKYSDYDFEILSSNSSYFLIPQNPPKEFSFSYGTIREPSFVKVTAIFDSPEESQNGKVCLLEEKVFAVSEEE